jgi:RNA polymerase subunit RPABC4/transcription elongation factor Spt4
MLLLAACGGSMTMKKPEQGLAGAFSVYGPPETLVDCAPKVTQADKDSCRRENQRVIEEPWRGTIIIRKLDTREKVAQAMDAEGKYRVQLDPGAYEVCVGDECSDPLDIRMGKWATYGSRLPRPAAAKADTAKTGAGAAQPAGGTPSANR